MPFCAQCGNQVRPAARFCTGCGTPRVQTKLNDRDADAVFRTAGLAVSPDSAVAVGTGRAKSQSPVVTHARTEQLDHMAQPDRMIDLGRLSDNAPGPTHGDSAQGIEGGGDGEPLVVLAGSNGAAIATRGGVPSVTDELPLPPAVLQNGHTAAGARSALLGNLLLAAGIALLIGLVTSAMDWSLGNKAPYFTADGVIALLTGLFLFGCLSLLDRWERRKGILSEV
jgi:hypothetical protein